MDKAAQELRLLAGRRAFLTRTASDEVPTIEIAGKVVYFKEHCRDRMRLRGITEEEACSVLRSRGITYPGNQGRTHILDTVSGRRIRVTVEETDTFCNVVTVVAPDEDEGT